MRKFGAALAVVTVGLVVVGWFYRPTSSTEWAAWIQTLGVLAAILWALRLQTLSSKQSLRQAGQVAAIFATNMHWVFRELNDACNKRSWPDYTVHRRILDEILAQGREVTLQLLDGRSLGDGEQLAGDCGGGARNDRAAYRGRQLVAPAAVFRQAPSEHLGLAVCDRPAAREQRADRLRGASHLLRTARRPLKKKEAPSVQDVT